MQTWNVIVGATVVALAMSCASPQTADRTTGAAQPSAPPPALATATSDTSKLPPKATDPTPESTPPQPPPQRWSWTAPDGEVVEVRDGAVDLKGKFQFELGKGGLRPQSEALVARLAAFLEQHPEVRRLRIEGHTDAVGWNKYNRWLSRERALSVALALVGRGIDCARLEPVGFGETRPYSHCPDGTRRCNRRIDLHIALYRAGTDVARPMPGEPRTADACNPERWPPPRRSQDEQGAPF